jgi:hypothetical protein
MPGGFGKTFVIEIHDEEGQIRCDIRVPEALIEFNAVNNLNVIGKVYMAGSQITVAIPNFACIYALLKKHLSSVQKRPGGRPDELKHPLVKYVPGELVCLLEIFLTIGPDGFPGTVGIYPFACGGLAIEFGKCLCQLFGGFPVHLSAPQQSNHGALLGELTHLDGVFNDLAQTIQKIAVIF